MIRSWILCSAAVCALAAPAEARDRERRVDVAPYIEASQVLLADLDGPNDVVTYTSLAAGVDASVQTRRVQVTASHRYEHRFAWDDDLGDEDIHSGLVRGNVAILPGFDLEGGALATRSRVDIRGDAPVNLAGNVANISQVYAVYGGPSLSGNLGPVSLGSAYRIGYNKVESPDLGLGLAPGAAPIDYYDDSTTQFLSGQASIAPGAVLPVGLTLSTQWEREDQSQLDNRYEGRYARGDAVLPVSPTVALVGGVGYENIQISGRDPLVDAAGVPVVDRNGRYVTDPASPRRIDYDFDGIFWDAGVLWRPNRRLSLEARAGERYDTFSFTGSLSWAASPSTSVQVGVYDTVTSYGRGIQRGLAALPTDFQVRRDPFGDQFDGCVFGRGEGNAGGCLTGLFQSLASASYRARGIDGIVTAARGRTTIGFGAGYANRKFLVRDTGPGSLLDGVADQSWYAQAFWSHALPDGAQVDLSVDGSYYDPGLALAGDVVAAGLTGSYGRSFGRLGATASAGVYYFDQDGFASDLVAQAVLGLRYGF